MSDRPRSSNSMSPFVAALVVGGFVWLVFDSVALGFVAAIATGLLINRDKRDDEDDREGA